MDFNKFQNESAKTDVGTSAQDALSPGWLYYVLGIGGEAGELTEAVKKFFRDDGGRMSIKFRSQIIKEMGDILWYMARLCSYLGINFEDVAKINVAKLKSRMERGKIHGSGDDR